MKFEELEALVIQWAEEKGILDKSTSLLQCAKTQEELTETISALRRNDYPEVVDGYGDLLVTIIIGCALSNIDPVHCLETAYNVIKSRTGKMVDGVFVKDK
jgi:NTP pyrophosphatase (non-canonical NTP hydrolase)